MKRVFTDFNAMGRHEATVFLGDFLACHEASLRRFAVEIGEELPLSEASLDQVWLLTAPKFAWREGYEPPEFGRPGPRIGVESLELPGELPMWFHHPSSAGYARFSADTLWLLDGVGRFLGEILIREAGGRWAVGHSALKGYVFQNQPVIEGVGRELLNPIQISSVLASRALRQGPERGPRTLGDVYRALR